MKSIWYNGQVIKLGLIKTENYLIIGLRWSIALVFFWFGALKVFGYNPVDYIIEGTFPMLAGDNGTLFLGIVEVVIGIGLAINLLPLITHLALIGHLAGTMLTFVVNPGLMFQPYFPILTLEGEFVIKNIVLAMAGIVVLIHENHKKIFHLS